VLDVVTSLGLGSQCLEIQGGWASGLRWEVAEYGLKRQWCVVSHEHRHLCEVVNTRRPVVALTVGNHEDSRNVVLIPRAHVAQAVVV
jgi:hypothetical protein